MQPVLAVLREVGEKVSVRGRRTAFFRDAEDSTAKQRQDDSK
jgi:hypothetical protein